MRRRTPGVLTADELLDPQLVGDESARAAEVVRVLEAIVPPKRQARILEVIGRRLAIVLGNERDGIAEELASLCTRRVRVPMRGFVESLNVSVTAAILLATATRGRTGDLDDDARLRLYARGLFHSVPRAREVLDHANVG